MPVTPNAQESLSGGSGVTRVNLVKRILLDRLDDNPWTELAQSALANAATVENLTLLPGVKTRYRKGGWIDYVGDGTFETLLIEEIINDTTLKLRHGHRGSTAAAHSTSAEIRYRGRVNPLTVSNNIDESMEDLWPDVFDIRHVDWTIPDPVDFWYVLPTDAEGVAELYYRSKVSGSNPVRLVGVENLGGPWFMDSGFLTGSNKKAVQAESVPGATATNDSRLHAIYQAKLTLAGLTTFQQTLITYDVASRLMSMAFASESKPERRSGLEGAPDAGNALRFFTAQAEAARKREAKRLAEFLPRKHRRQYRGMRHYSERGGEPIHPVRT